MSTPDPTKPLELKSTAEGEPAAPKQRKNPEKERDIDPRAAAAKRAEDLLKNWGGEIPEGADDFYVDPTVIPPGWSYEWKRLTILNAPDPSYQVQIASAGWEPVPTYRHPDMMPVGHDKGAQVTRKGMGLFERPLVITEQAKAMELRKARSQVNQKEAQLNSAPQGQFDRQKSDGSPLVNIKKSYEAIPIPK